MRTINLYHSFGVDLPYIKIAINIKSLWDFKNLFIINAFLLFKKNLRLITDSY